jgi:hypothetical protein
MHTFLKHNRHELIERCKVKVAQRPKRAATAKQLENGVPMFLDQLTRTLEAEQANEADQSMQISGPAGGDVRALSEMGVSATAHGKQLLKLGYTVDQVVHDYGDLCQAITDLAFERDAPFAVAEFRTLNRCLDNAIADAVTEFSAQRDTKLAELQAFETIERSGLLAHELRNSSLAKYSKSCSRTDSPVVSTLVLAAAGEPVMSESASDLRVRAAPCVPTPRGCARGETNVLASS